MELQQLRYFQVTARCEHMTKAAQELNVSQPALSKTIARLEEGLGAPLFHREGRQIRLNNFGSSFLVRVDRIFQEIEEGQRQIRDMSGLDNGIISVGISLPHILPFLLTDFLKLHPKVEIKQYQIHSKDMRGPLEQGSMDICISSSPIFGGHIEWMPLLEEEIFLSVPSNHPFADRNSISLEEVKDEIFINRFTGYEFRDLCDHFCSQAGFTANTSIELEEAGAILRLVELGAGISFTPQLSLLNKWGPNTVQLRISNPNCKRTIGIAWNKEHYLTKAAVEFRQFTVDFFRNIVSTYYHQT